MGRTKWGMTNDRQNRRFPALGVDPTIEIVKAAKVLDFSTFLCHTASMRVHVYVNKLEISHA